VKPVPLLLALLVVAAVAGLAPAAYAGDMYSSHSEYGYAGFSPGGALYINALPSNAEVGLDGVLVGVANDLQHVHDGGLVAGRDHAGPADPDPGALVS
jgi:hypothetical protein